jgi:sulfate permease, SulP family
VMGLARLGRIVAKVPFSIVIGFTIGIAVVIVMSQIEAALGLPSNSGYQGFFTKISGIVSQFGEISMYAVILTLVTFLITKYLLKISKFIPAPLIAIGVGILLSTTIWKDVNLTTVFDKYGNIPVRFDFTPPAALAWEFSFLFNVFYYALAIVFVAAIESLLCSRMADRMANNKGLPFRPNKELWGQGWVNIITPLLNGFPHTGALARTATNIEVGGQSPLAGIFKFITKLLLAAYLATYLEMVPIACIAGILLYVASAMIKIKDIREIMANNRFEVFIMAFTAIMVIVTDFLIGVLSGIMVYFIVTKLFPNITQQVGDAESKKLTQQTTLKEKETV